MQEFKIINNELVLIDNELQIAKVIFTSEQLDALKYLIKEFLSKRVS